MSEAERPGGVAAAQELALEADLGGRSPTGAVAWLLAGAAFAWALFQLWIASPLPFAFNVFILDDTKARAIHLAFGMFLAFTAYPAFKRSPRRYVPWQDWLFALLGAASSAYLYVFYSELSQRPGLPTTTDMVVSLVGMLLLLEASRRALGPALSIIAIIFLGYVFAGPWLPTMMAHKGASLSRAASQFWLTTEGVFGVALGVSTSFVFLFVLFGSLLEKAGAGNYFIKLSFAVLGHLRGGPAKAAVVSSGLTGVISGSSIANVVTTGTFTIPLMKRVGYSATKAGAVEVAASVNGQLMPPVMGAAAFLIAEYVGIPYTEVVKHAFLPAIATYISLFYIVHLEAVKAGLQGLPRRRRTSRVEQLASAGMTIAGFVAVCGLVYYGVGWVKEAFGDAATLTVAALGALLYLGLIAYRARQPDLELDDPDSPVIELPEAGPVAKTGLHFLIPVFVLIWCLMIEHLSPGLSAFWATAVLIGILVTQRPLTALFRRQGPAEPFARGLRELLDGMVAGSRNMIGIAIATAAAGFVVGTVSLTGIGLVMTELVDFLSGGNVIAMLLLTAFICLVLGMGLPTTANYVVVATLMAPVVVELAAQNDLAVPLVAVHLFVFYFGLMADVTPPVGLASFAASAISGADPIATGIQAFKYEIRTALLPFIFVFNHQLLMIGVDDWWVFALTIVSTIGAMLLFVAATQGWFLVKSRIWETAALILVIFTLFRPGYWLDMIAPPFDSFDPKRIEELAQAQPEDGYLRLKVSGETLLGKPVSKTVRLPLGPPAPGAQRLQAVGLAVGELDGKTVIEDVRFRSVAAKHGLDLDYVIEAVELPAARPAKEWFFLPALAILGLVVAAQLARARRARPAAA
jgi:TRAP transporter 4TM/12TM fusion protein